MQLVTPDSFSVPAHIDVVTPPTVSWNVATPVGTPDPGAVAVTLVAYVTDCPYTEGFTVDVGVDVVVGSWFTVWTGLRFPVEVKKFPSPL